MFKENGRLGEKVSKDKASINGKEFICSTCGKTKSVSNVEFGEEVLCECGQTMIENNEE